MQIEEVVQLLEREGGTRGKTASPGSTYYEAAKSLDFVPCRCSDRDQDYRGHDYIARSPNGTYHYIGINLRKQISCGPKGYHHYSGTPACI
jgi:hypothetical protein